MAKSIIRVSSKNWWKDKQQKEFKSGCSVDKYVIINRNHEIFLKEVYFYFFMKEQQTDGQFKLYAWCSTADEKIVLLGGRSDEQTKWIKAKLRFWKWLTCLCPLSQYHLSLFPLGSLFWITAIRSPVLTARSSWPPPGMMSFTWYSLLAVYLPRRYVRCVFVCTHWKKTYC